MSYQYAAYQPAPAAPPPAAYQSGHYPSHYPAPAQGPLAPAPQSYFPLYQPPQPRSPPPPPEPPLSPLELSTVTAPVASKAIRRLISHQLQKTGFDGAEPLALQRLELEVTALCERLYQSAHEYANLANRAGPIATDLLRACEELELQPKDLHRVGFGKGKGKKRQRSTAPITPATLIPAPSRSPSPELLASDDEGTIPTVPSTLRGLPSFFPDLPPKHTYLRTPASPPKKAALPSLEKKLKTAGLVQESLRKLLEATEDSPGQEDGELLGHLVNWEAGMHPRKRWKLGV